MTDKELIDAFVSGELDEAGMAQLEAELRANPDLIRELADQQQIEQALDVLLGDDTADQQVTVSVLSVLRADPLDSFKKDLLAEVKQEAEIRRRQEALGVAPEVQAQGLFIGVSDPSRSSWRKFGRIEDDLGILWLHPAALIYRGDANGWDLPAPGVVAVERAADSGATSSYFGASGVVLRMVDAYGRESHIRLHPQGAWTLTGQARRLNELAERLQAWKDDAAAQAPPAQPPPLSPSPAPEPA